MPYFLRALRLTFRYRMTLIGASLCSLLVAILWGGNIGALYPVFEVVMRNRSLQQWIDEEIATSQTAIANMEAELQALRRQPGMAEGPRARDIEHQLQIERAALRRSTLIKPWIDRYLPRDPFQTVVVVILALMVATIIKDACLVGNLVLVARLNNLVALDLQRQFYSHALSMDPTVFGKRGTAGMMAHMGADIYGVGQGLNSLYGAAVREPLKIISCLIGAALISWRLLLFSLILAPIAAILLRLLAVSIRRATHHLMQDGLLLNQVIFETFNGLSVVQSFTMEEYEKERFNTKSQDCMRRGMKIVLYNALTKPITEVLGLGIVCIALLAGAYLVLTGRTELLGLRMCDRPMDLPYLLVFYGLLVGISDPARKLGEIFGTIQSGIAAAERLYPILDTPPLIQDPPHPVPVPRPHRRIVIEDVHFHYTPDRPVLRGVSLEIPFGETVAIVGPNGCGKTTLVNMLPRFYDPVAGRICLDETDLRNVSLRELRGCIGIVSQQFPLFNDTVWNNIRYGSPNATREQIVEAAKKAHAHRFIEQQLEHGYDTIVGEGGGRISGGQRQRIALARAMLRDPDILILDEATSQVDLESEQLIHKALHEFTRNRTAIIITHRLSTLALAHRVVVMDGGRIIDYGTHEDLMARCELYRRLHEIQFRQSA